MNDFWRTVKVADASNINLFVSYGRRDAAEFVDKLAVDLRRAGFTVWRDTVDVRTSFAWDEQTAEAIKKCDAMIAILTPSSVRIGREPDDTESVCLDELAFARFSAPPTDIVPIMLLACEPPFIIYRLNYLDFRQAISDEARYQEALEILVKTIRAAKAGEKPAYRISRFEPLNFDLYLNSKTRDFVGREWLLDDVMDRLQVAKAPPALLLVGEPGWGKTAFAAHLFRANPGGTLLAAHFCRADRPDTLNSRRFIESLVAMVGVRVPAFGERIKGIAEQGMQLLSNGQVKEAFERLFLEPIAGLDLTGLGTPRYILVDSLDEAAAADSRPSIHKLLAETITLFPDYLRLVATSRHKADVVDSFGAATILSLDHDDPRNRRDVQNLITRLLKPQETLSTSVVGGLGCDIDSVLKVVDSKAEGNALCASQLALAVRKSGLNAASIDAVPRGLAALYQTLLQRRFDPKTSDWIVVRELLEMIAATKAALPIQLAAVARGDEAQYATRAALESVSDLVITVDDTVCLFHQTLLDFLLEPTTPFFVNASQGAVRLTDLVSQASRRATLKPSLKTFCGRNMGSWLLQASDLNRCASELASAYDELVFSRPAEPVSYYVAGVTIDPADEQLIARLAALHQEEALIEIIKLAFMRAEERFGHSGALPWVTDGHRPRPDDALKILIGREIDACFRLTCFALSWSHTLAGVSPELRARLQRVIGDQGKLGWAIGWIDVGVGCYTLGLSGYFEDQASAIRRDWGEIESKLA
jgi:hypothetical protein